VRFLEAVCPMAEFLSVKNTKLKRSSQNEDEALREIEDLLDEEILHLEGRELHTSLSLD
jgi:hypothetical protein